MLVVSCNCTDSTLNQSEGCPGGMMALTHLIILLLTPGPTVEPLSLALNPLLLRLYYVSTAFDETFSK